MSTEREIRLIGVFRDDITPKLEKLNKTINETVRTFSRFTRALRPLAKEMGTVAYAGKTLELSLVSQRNSFQAAARSMVAYRRELRRTASLQKMVAGGRLVPNDFMTGPRATRAGTMPRPSARANYSQRQATAGRGGAGRTPAMPMPAIPQMPRTPRAPRGMQPPMMPMMPAAPMAPGGRPPIPPAPRGGASVPAPSMADGAAGAAFGVTLGNQIGSIVTNAIMTGFQKSMQLIKKPFTFLAHEFGHAMGEEMADITASGAMYALDKSSGTKMFKDFEDARQAQEMLDQRLAKSASSLPGQTLQYVQQARQLQDTVMIALGKDQEGFMKKAEEMGAIAGNMKDSFAVVLSQFTERAVLLGQDQGGSGGLGVPQLLERMVTMEKVNISGMSTRFGALISNPLLKGALERNEAAINATTVGTIERIQAIQKALDEALPQEVITAMTMTMKGISEGFRSSLFDISSGLFGIRRMVTGVKAQAFKMTGEIKADVAEALSLFDMLRDTIGFFVVPFLQLANILPQIYDPMLGLIDTLIPLRKLGAGFALRFHGFAKGFEDFAKEAFPDVKTQAKFLETRGPRAALRAMADLLHAFDSSFVGDDIVKELLTLEPDFGKIGKTLITGLLDSPFMEMVGETIGFFVSELLTVMANLLTGVTDFATSSKFAQGLVKGLEGRFDESGHELGMSAFKAIEVIFNKVFEIMGKLLLTIVTKMPLQTALLVGITAVLPAAIAGFGAKLGTALAALLGRAGKMAQVSLLGTKVTAKAAGAGTGATGAEFIGRGGGRYGLGGSMDRLNRMRRGQMARSAGRMAEPWMNFASTSALGQKAGGMARGVGRFGRAIPGGALAAGALDLGISLATGENIGKAAAGAIGTVLGATAGSIFGPVGTIIGGMAGSTLANMAYDALDPSARIQREAAQMQLEAAGRRQTLADLTSRLGVTAAQYQFGEIKELTTRLKFLGLASDSSAQAFLKEYGERNVAMESLKQFDKQLQDLTTSLSFQQLPKEEQERQTSALRESIAGASTIYEREQRELEAAFAQTPKSVTDALIGSVASKMTVPQMEREISSKQAEERRAERAGRRGTAFRRFAEDAFIGPRAPAGALTGTAADRATTESASTLKDIDQKQKEATSTLQKVDDSTKRAVVATSGLSAKFNAPIAVRIVDLPTMGGFPTFSPFGGGSGSHVSSKILGFGGVNPPPGTDSILPGIDTSGFSMLDGRASGGPVSAGKMYMVGERGPELFMSGSSGQIVPNNALGGTSVTVGTINVNGANAKEIADDVASELVTAMQRQFRSEVLTS